MFSELYPVRQPDHPRKLGEAVSPGRQGTGFDKREDAGELRGQRAAKPETGGGWGNRRPSLPPRPPEIWLIPKGAGKLFCLHFSFGRRNRERRSPWVLLGQAWRTVPTWLEKMLRKLGPLWCCPHCGLRLPVSAAGEKAGRVTRRRTPVPRHGYAPRSPP